MHYCIGDVHGCFDQLMDLISKIESQDSDARFVLLGDLVDRGPKSWEMLNWAMAHITPDGKYQSVMGNHEDLILEWFQFRFLPWYNLGCHGPMPHSKFDFYEVAEKNGLTTPRQLEPVMDFFWSLPLRIELPVTRADGEQHLYVAVHAWYDKKVKNGILQRRMNLRLRNTEGNPDPSYTVVFGHTPTFHPEYIRRAKITTPPGRIAYLTGAVNLDGGCCFGLEEGIQANLCGLCLETGEEFYASLAQT